MDTVVTLKRLIKIWAIILDISPKAMMERVMERLKIDSFKDNKEAQKRAIDYLQKKLEGSENNEHLP